MHFFLLLMLLLQALLVKWTRLYCVLYRLLALLHVTTLCSRCYVVFILIFTLRDIICLKTFRGKIIITTTTTIASSSSSSSSVIMIVCLCVLAMCISCRLLVRLCNMYWGKKAWCSLHPTYLIIPTYSKSTHKFFRCMTSVNVYTVRQVICVNITLDLFTSITFIVAFVFVVANFISSCCCMVLGVHRYTICGV